MFIAVLLYSGMRYCCSFCSRILWSAVVHPAFFAVGRTDMKTSTYRPRCCVPLLTPCLLSPCPAIRVPSVVVTMCGVLQDEDEEQGTLKFGKQKEQASYGGMDEEEKAIWKVHGCRRSRG